MKQKSDPITRCAIVNSLGVLSAFNRIPRILAGASRCPSCGSARSTERRLQFTMTLEASVKARQRAPLGACLKRAPNCTPFCILGDLFTNANGNLKSYLRGNTGLRLPYCLAVSIIIDGIIMASDGMLLIILNLCNTQTPAPADRPNALPFPFPFDISPTSLPLSNIQPSCVSIFRLVNHLPGVADFSTGAMLICAHRRRANGGSNP